MNIWVANIDNAAGYSSFPEELSSNPELDGIVIDYAFFGDLNSIGEGTNGFDLGRTATHEVGHWLGLDHLWFNRFSNNGGCSYDDGVTDTPNQANATVISGLGFDGCNEFVGKNTCGSGGGDLPDMYQNYMDYTPDDCMNLFTQGQKDKMRAVLNVGGARVNFNYYLPNVPDDNYIGCGSSSSVALNSSPDGAATTWSVANPSYVNVASGTGNPAFVQASNGYQHAKTDITFKIRGGDGSSTDTDVIIIKEDITVGKPSQIYGNMSGPTSVTQGSNVQWSIPSQQQYDGTITWTKPLNWSLTSGGNGRNWAFYLVGSSSGYVQVFKNNTCGNGGAKWKYVTVTGAPCQICEMTIVAGPNPVGNELTIMYVNVSVTEIGLTAAQFEYIEFATTQEYIIRNDKGRVVHRENANSNIVVMDLKNIRKGGTYYLHIYDKGENIYQKRLLLDR